MLVNEAVVRAYLESYGSSFNENEHEFMVHSPFFQRDRQNKLYISKKNGKWIDFLAAGDRHYQGRFDKLVAMMEHVPMGHARRKIVDLCFQHGVDIFVDEAVSDVLRSSTDNKLPVPMPEGLPMAWDHPIARGYLVGRGLSKETAELYQIRHNRCNATVVLPFIRNGRVLYYMERYIDRNNKMRWRNADACGPEFFSKADMLYGEHTVTSVDDILFITEGAFDSIKITQFGFQSMAVCGSSMSQNQLDLLKLNNFRRIALALDFDDAGVEATYNMADMLMASTDSEVLFNHSRELMRMVGSMGKKDWGDLTEDVFYSYVQGLVPCHALARVERSLENA